MFPVKHERESRIVDRTDGKGCLVCRKERRKSQKISKKNAVALPSRDMIWKARIDLWHSGTEWPWVLCEKL
jgi:hypothetical protein